MTETLEEQYDKILGITPEEPKEDEKVEAQPEEKPDSENKEGEVIPSEIEEELKNVDPELKEILLKTDPEVRKAQLSVFNKMRASIDRKHTEFGHQKKIAEAAQNLFSKYGLDPNTGLSQVEKLIQFEEEYKKNPAKVISLLQAHNKSAGDTGSEIDEEQFTEQEKYLYKQIKNIEESNQKLVRENEELKQLRQKQEVERAKNEIIEFAEAKGEDGNLKHPYFYEVAEDIQKLLTIFPNDNIDQLYSRAVRLNDQVYQKTLTNFQEQEKKRLEKEQQLKKAKNLNGQSLKVSSSPNEPKTLDDILSDIYDKSQGF